MGSLVFWETGKVLQKTGGIEREIRLRDTGRKLKWVGTYVNAEIQPFREGIETERDRERQRGTDRNRERQRDRETERQRDRETKRQRDRETERQNDRRIERKQKRKTDRNKNRNINKH
jgi:hypothetical protein